MTGTPPFRSSTGLPIYSRPNNTVWGDVATGRHPTPLFLWDRGFHHIRLTSSGSSRNSLTVAAFLLLTPSTASKIPHLKDIRRYILDPCRPCRTVRPYPITPLNWRSRRPRDAPEPSPNLWFRSSDGSPPSTGPLSPHWQQGDSGKRRCEWSGILDPGASTSSVHLFTYFPSEKDHARDRGDPVQGIAHLGQLHDRGSCTTRELYDEAVRLRGSQQPSRSSLAIPPQLRPIATSALSPGLSLNH